MQFSGTIATATVTTTRAVRPRESIAVKLSVANGKSVVGTVSVEASFDGQNWLAVQSFTGTAGVPLTESTLLDTTFTNTLNHLIYYRIRFAKLGVGTDGVVWSIVEGVGAVVETVLADADGQPVITKNGDGTYRFLGGRLAGTFQVVRTGAIAVALDLGVYETRLVTGGTAGAELVTIGNGSTAVPGQRKLITETTRTNASDVPTLDHGNIINNAGAALAAVTLDAATAFLLLEWTGAKWKVLYSGNATLTAA